MNANIIKPAELFVTMAKHLTFLEKDFNVNFQRNFCNDELKKDELKKEAIIWEYEKKENMKLIN